MTASQSTTRRNLFRVGAATAVAAALPTAAMTIGGSDAELLAMIEKANALWAQSDPLTIRHINVIESLLSPERESHSNEEWKEAAEHPRALAVERELRALTRAAESLDEPIRNAKPTTLEGAVAQAEFIGFDGDCKEIVLANLRRIMEARA